MKLQKQTLESKLFGCDMYKITNWNSIQDIRKIEHTITHSAKPTYLFCEIDSTDLQTIHDLEDFGYQFSEFRIFTSLRLEDHEVSAKAFFPYIAEVITDKANFGFACDMLAKMNADDRFSKDPIIGKEFSLSRTLKNLKKSFKNWPKEFLIGIFNQQSDELIAFRSGAFLSQNEAQFYQYGVSEFKDQAHTTEVLDSLTLNFLIKRGIKIVYAVSTGFNTSELNRLIRSQNFKIETSKVLLRKIFK